MNNLKTYEEFNWRKGAAGVALGAALLGGGAATLPSCGKGPLENPVGNVHNTMWWTNDVTDCDIDIWIEGSPAVISLQPHPNKKQYTQKMDAYTNGVYLIGRNYVVREESVEGKVIQTGVVKEINIVSRDPSKREK